MCLTGGIYVSWLFHGRLNKDSSNSGNYKYNKRKENYDTGIMGADPGWTGSKTESQ